MNMTDLERAARLARYALDWIKDDIVNESDYELVHNAIQSLDSALDGNKTEFNNVE
jgi:hypothetical protein